MRLIGKGVIVLLGLAQTCISPALGQSTFRGTFAYEVKQSNVMKVGARSLVTVQAVAMDMKRNGPITFTGVDVFFLPRKTVGTVSTTTEELRRGTYANVNVLTGASGKVTQVNMTLVFPGNTIARTVAWKPDDLRNYFPNLSVSAHRIVIKSRGTYDDPKTDSEQVHLRWDIDIDVPIVRDSRK